MISEKRAISEVRTQGGMLKEAVFIQRCLEGLCAYMCLCMVCMCVVCVCAHTLTSAIIQDANDKFLYREE